MTKTNVDEYPWSDPELDALIALNLRVERALDAFYDEHGHWPATLTWGVEERQIHRDLKDARNRRGADVPDGDPCLYTPAPDIKIAIEYVDEPSALRFA